MTQRPVSILTVGPVHPGRGEPSRIEMTLVLEYLNGQPVTHIVITPEKAVELIEKLAMAVRVTA